jgi:hypothetical protein
VALVPGRNHLGGLPGRGPAHPSLSTDRNSRQIAARWNFSAYENKLLVLNIRGGAFDHMETIHAIEPGVKEKIAHIANYTSTTPCSFRHGKTLTIVNISSEPHQEVSLRSPYSPASGAAPSVNCASIASRSISP